MKRKSKYNTKMVLAPVVICSDVMFSPPARLYVNTIGKFLSDMSIDSLLYRLGIKRATCPICRVKMKYKGENGRYRHFLCPKCGSTVKIPKNNGGR